jgi:hypothetical protein
MKSRIAERIILILAALWIGLPDICVGQVKTDPLVLAAVENERSALTTQLSKQNSSNLTIAGLNTGIALQLDSIHKYEKMMYEYLSQASSVISNAYDVYRCGDLVLDIKNALADCSKEAVNHPQGAIVSVIVSKQYTRVYEESISLYGYIASLLNSVERTQILVQVKNRLSQILRTLTALKYQIRLYRWIDVARELAPSEYYRFLGMESVVSRIKRDIDRMSK